MEPATFYLIVVRPIVNLNFRITHSFLFLHTDYFLSISLSLVLALFLANICQDLFLFTFLAQRLIDVKSAYRPTICCLKANKASTQVKASKEKEKKNASALFVYFLRRAKKLNSDSKL